MSTSYGFGCAEHFMETYLHAADGPTGRESLAAIWRIRGPLETVLATWDANLIRGHEWFGIEPGERTEELERFAVAHSGCPVEIVSEYGDRELAQDVVDGLAEAHPDADEVVRRVLTLLGFPDDVIARTTTTIVDAMDGARMLSWRHRPERLRS